jgi:hypothetical protein
LLRAGPGTDSPKCRCSGFNRPRWIPESPLIVVPGPLSTRGARVDLELSPDRVGDSSLQGAECFFADLAFGLAAEVVGTSGCIVGDLSDGDHVDCVVQLAVTARVQPLSFTIRAGCFDRCGSVVAGELGADPKPGDVVNVAEHDRGDDRTDVVQLAQRRARGDDGVTAAISDRLYPAVTRLVITMRTAGSMVRDRSPLSATRRPSSAMLRTSFGTNCVAR